MAAIEQTSRPMIGRNHSAVAGKNKLAIPVALYLVAVMLPVGFYLGPLYLNLVRLVLLAMIVPLTFKLLTGQYGRILVPDVFFFLYVLWIIISITITDPDRAIEHIGSTGIEFIGSYVLARAYIRTAAAFTSLIRMLVLMVVLTLPIALYELITNHPLILEALRSIPGIKTEWVVRGGDEMRMGLFRVQGVFAHPIHYGMFCSVPFALCYIGLKDVYGTAKRYAALAIITICTFTSLSSGALLPIFLQAGLIAWAYAFKWTERRWLILAGMILLAYVVVSLLSNRTPLMVFLSYATFSPATAYWRYYEYQYGMENVWANPWFGLGLTSDWVRPDWMVTSSVDNFWLLVAMRYGIPGVLLLLFGYLTPLWSIARRQFDRDTNIWRLRRAWVIVFVGLTLALVTVAVWSTLFSFVFFMFGAGMWFLTITPEKGEGTARVGNGSGRSIPPPRSGIPGLARGQMMANNQNESALQPGPSDTGAKPPDIRTAPLYTRFPPKTRTSVTVL